MSRRGAVPKLCGAVRCGAVGVVMVAFMQAQAQAQAQARRRRRCRCRRRRRLWLRLRRGGQGQGRAGDEGQRRWRGQAGRRAPPASASGATSRWAGSYEEGGQSMGWELRVGVGWGGVGGGGGGEVKQPIVQPKT